MVTSAPNRDLRRAHTLWEVLLVLTVLGAVFALAAPSLTLVRRQTGDVSEAAREIGSLLEAARLTALQRGTSIEVRADPATGRAWVFATESDTLRLISTLVLSNLSAVEILDGAEPRLRYAISPDGQTFGRRVVFRGTEGIRQMIVDPWTGGIHVTR